MTGSFYDLKSHSLIDCVSSFLNKCWKSLRILKKHNLVWLSKPKTGSTSIRKMLDPFSDIISRNQRPFYHHATLKQAIEDMKQKGIPVSPFKFFICDRNPYLLIPSLWKYSKININYQKFWDNDYDDTIDKLPFSDFVKDKKTWE